MQSAANCTGLPSSSESRVATGRRLILGLGLPLGRPRCEARIRRAPCSTAYRIVGSVARIRVSSVMDPASSSGTLKSTRIKTRLPVRLMSRMDNLFTGLLLHLETESSRQKANNASSLAYRLQLLTSDRSEALGVLHHRSNRSAQFFVTDDQIVVLLF